LDVTRVGQQAQAIPGGRQAGQNRLDRGIDREDRSGREGQGIKIGPRVRALAENLEVLAAGQLAAFVAGLQLDVVHGLANSGHIDASDFGHLTKALLVTEIEQDIAQVEVEKRGMHGEKQNADGRTSRIT
jgi:hypothetical protein